MVHLSHAGPEQAQHSIAGDLLSVAERNAGILNALSDELAACVPPRGCCMHSSSCAPRALVTPRQQMHAAVVKEEGRGRDEFIVPGFAAVVDGEDASNQARCGED